MHTALPDNEKDLGGPSLDHLVVQQSDAVVLQATPKTILTLSGQTLKTNEDKNADTKKKTNQNNPFHYSDSQSWGGSEWMLHSEDVNI